MAHDTKCPSHGTPCDPPNNAFCSNHGICCMFSPDDRTQDFCSCDTGYEGPRCETRTRDASKALDRVQNLAALSAILGVAIFIFIVVIVVLQVKYYRRRKNRLLHDHEMNKVSIRDGSESVKVGKKRLSIQPGYSWRQSVRGHSKRLRGVSCKSVPDDLFMVGLQSISDGESGKQINFCQIRDASRDEKYRKRVFSEGTGVCFSRSLSIGQKQGTEVSGQSKRQETGIDGDKDKLIQ